MSDIQVVKNKGYYKLRGRLNLSPKEDIRDIDLSDLNSSELLYFNLSTRKECESCFKWKSLVQFSSTEVAIDDLSDYNTVCRKCTESKKEYSLVMSVLMSKAILQKIGE